MSKAINISLCDDIFSRVKSSSELRTRLTDELTDHIIATDSDLDQFRVYFRDFIAEFKNVTATYGRLKDYDGMLSYQLTDSEHDHKLIELAPLLSRITQEYLLYRWYDDLGIAQLAGDSWAKYQTLLGDWKNHSARTSFVVPKYRPYF